MRQLKGKRVLITGGAQGIGLALARGFGSSGARIILADLRGNLLDGAAKELRSGGIGVSTCLVDVTVPEAIAAARDRIHADGGPVDVLVNNAGVVFGGPFTEVPLDRHLMTLRVNTMGLVAMTHAFLPDLVSQPEGHLVNISSASGYISLPFGSTYASSKWSVIGFSDSIRRELEMLGHRHVHVTTVCPSYVSTGLFDGVRPPLFAPLLTPEKLAAQTLRAVRRNRKFLLTPWLVKLAPPLVAVLPTWLADRIAWGLRVSTSMVHWHGRESK
jgi:short-subunit dehydrogenase